MTTPPKPTAEAIDYSDRRGGVFVVQDGKRVRQEPVKPAAEKEKRAAKAPAVTPTETTDAQ